MKKLILAIFIVLLLITGCTSKDSMLLKSEQAAEKFVNEESFVLYVSSSTCPACLAYDPVYEEVSKDFKDVMYKIDYHKEVTSNEEVFKEFVVNYIPFVDTTPTTLFIVDGEIVGAYVGIMKFDELSQTIKNYKVVE